MKTAFQQPRKTLSKNLTSAHLKPQIQAAFEQLDLGANLRPHELSTTDYHRLFHILQKGSQHGSDNPTRGPREGAPNQQP